MKLIKSLNYWALCMATTCAFAGNFDGAISTFFSSSKLKENIQALQAKGLINFAQAPGQTVSPKDGNVNDLIKRIDPQASSLAKALTHLTSGNRNALTDLRPQSNAIQKLIDQCKAGYAQAVRNNGGFDPKDYGVDVDITTQTNPNPQSLTETNEALLTPLRNFFSKRKKLFDEKPASSLASILGNFFSFNLGWNFVFHAEENQPIHFDLNFDYVNVYSGFSHGGDPEKELTDLSDIFDLYFHVPEEDELSQDDPLNAEFLSLLRAKENRLRTSFFAEKNQLFFLKEKFLGLSSDKEKEEALQKLERS